MDARERLRRYLEQRQEMGEQELFLDTMTVDDVMKAIGAINADMGAGNGGFRATGAKNCETKRLRPRLESTLPLMQ